MTSLWSALTFGEMVVPIITVNLLVGIENAWLSGLRSLILVNLIPPTVSLLLINSSKTPQIKHKPHNLSIKFGQFYRPMDFSSPQNNLFFGFRVADVPSSGMENSPTSKHPTRVLR
jgi:hypothetical protein